LAESYYDAPKHVMGFTWNKKGSDIYSFPEWERTFLYLPLKKPADIGEGLNRLLSALLKQLD
jgi:hypothetical protein